MPPDHHGDPWLAWLQAQPGADGAAAWHRFARQLAGASVPADWPATENLAAGYAALFRSFGASAPPSDSETGHTAGAEDAALLAAWADLHGRLARIGAGAGEELQARLAAGGQPQPYELFRIWVDAYERRLQLAVTDAQFGASFARAVNALFGACEAPAGSRDPARQTLQAAIDALRGQRA